MEHYLSIDGGGTKTAFLLTDETGRKLASCRLGSASYTGIGFDGMERLFTEGIDAISNMSGIQRSSITSATWGIPNFGENPALDSFVTGLFPRLLPNTVHHIANDVELGFSGSLLLGTGIHMVAGTGAIAMGKNSEGLVLRSNGWHETFSDEGSAYWLGIETLRLFTMQADGRKEKGHLYDIIRNEWILNDDFEIVPYFLKNLHTQRDKIAQVQIILHQAALRGDPAAVEIYRTAAHHLYLSIRALYERLEFEQDTPVNVSYSGGVFKAQEFIMSPLRSFLSSLNVHLIPPQLSPVSGGILLAARAVGKSDITSLITNLIDQENKMEKKNVHH